MVVVTNRDSFLDLLIGKTSDCKMAKDERGVREGGQGSLCLEGESVRLSRLCGTSGVKVDTEIVVLAGGLVVCVNGRNRGGGIRVTRVHRASSIVAVFLLHCSCDVIAVWVVEVV